MVAFALLSLVPASDLVLSVLNWDVTHFFAPRILPKMDFSSGVPAEAQTFVVIPTFLTSEATVDELLEKLEVHYLANRDEHLYFALLGDFIDAPSEEMPEDAALLGRALDRVERLKARSGEELDARFHLFHRRPLWNQCEAHSLGWGGKR